MYVFLRVGCVGEEKESYCCKCLNRHCTIKALFPVHSVTFAPFLSRLHRNNNDNNNNNNDNKYRWKKTPAGNITRKTRKST